MNAVKSFVAALLLAAVPAADAVPTALAGETLDRRQLMIPRDLREGPVLLIVGFSRASSAATGGWSRAVAADAAIGGEAAVYRVAVIAGAPPLVRGFVARQMRRGIPPALHGSSVLVTAQEDAWKRWVAFSDPDAAYVLLLDRARDVAWRAQGGVDAAALEALRAAIGRMEDAP